MNKNTDRYLDIMLSTYAYSAERISLPRLWW